MKKDDILYKIRKIGELVGERSVFRIGVDSKNGRIDLLSIDVCDKISMKEIAKIPNDELLEAPDYIG